MSTTVLYMSMSLDGYVAGPNAGPDNGLGDGGDRLHDWVLTDDGFASDGVNGQIVREFMSTGAIVAGPGTFEPAGGWGGDHHDGVPIFIYSRREPGIDISGWPLVTYLDDLPTAVARAREAPATAACSSTGPRSRSSASRPGCSTSWRSTWCRSCSAVGARCSAASSRPASSWSAPGRWRARAA